MNDPNKNPPPFVDTFVDALVATEKQPAINFDACRRPNKPNWNINDESTAEIGRRKVAM